jgi:hypothetical protein
VTAPAGLAGMARDTLSALLALVPRALWRGVKGGLLGFLLAGLVGLAAAGASATLLSLPSWLDWLQLFWVPLALSLGGAYVGAVNGLLSAVTEELQRRGLALRLYGIVKPAARAAARRLAARAPGRGGAVEVGAALREELETRLGDPAELGQGTQRSERTERTERSLFARFERFLAVRSRRVLCFSAVRSIVQAKDPASARAALETLGADTLEGWMVETVEDLFLTQLVLAAALSLLAAALPGLLYALGLSLGV